MLGRRERNKLERRRAIRLAGLRLFAERGYDQTTVGEIADAADVAHRTVSLYYPTKLDIALSVLDEIVADLVPSLTDRRDGASLVDIFERWLRDLIQWRDFETLELLGEVFQRNPGIRALANARIQPVADHATAILAEDLGGDRQGFTASMVGAMVGTGVASLLTLPPATEADSAIAVTMTFLRAGIAAVRSAPTASGDGSPAVITS